jgi:hypothetical protein
MTYELAQKLKKAGFPQRRNPVRFFDTQIDSEGNLITEGEMVHIPNLSELIEVCGDIILYKLPKDNEWNSNTKDVWVADKIGSYFCADEHFVDTDVCGETGLTPEIAVANLYLKLNK